MNYLPLISVVVMLIPVIVMIVSDFRRREVAVWSLILFSITSMATAIYSYGWSATVTNIVHNALVLCYLGVGLLIYMRIRYRRFVNPLNGYLGAGDLWFMLALSPLFPSKEFLIFLLVTMAGSLIWWVIRGRNGTIPLAGMLGIALGVYLLGIYPKIL